MSKEINYYNYYFQGCDCEVTCPANCTCYHDHEWSVDIVECSSSSRMLAYYLPIICVILVSASAATFKAATVW